jgi:hypothetical protein
MAEYTAAYCHPGAFQAAMEMYRQFPQDAADNVAAGPLPSPYGGTLLACAGSRA